MTVIEYLRRPEAIRQEIARKTVRVRVLRRHAQRITSAMRDVRVKSTPDPARMQAFLSEAADEEKAIAGLQQELARSWTKPPSIFPSCRRNRWSKSWSSGIWQAWSGKRLPG